MSWIGDWWHGRDEEESDDLERMVLEASELHGVPPKQVIKTVFEDEDDLDEEELLDDDDEAEDKPRGKVAAYATFVVIGLVFGGTIIVLMKLANMADKAGPSANSYLQQVTKSIAPKPTAPSELVALNLFFSYPSIFNTVEKEADWNTSSQRYMIGSTSDYRRSISVMVDNFPDLVHDPNYLYRSEDKKDYTPQRAKIKNEQAVVMVKGDNTERTLFWPHAGHVVVISVVSTNVTDSTASFMAEILNTVGWRATPQ